MIFLLHVCMQIENELGFIGPDETYLRHISQIAKEALGDHDDDILFTTNPVYNQDNGVLRDEMYT